MPIKNTSARRNGKPHAITVRYAGGQALRLGKIDLRFKDGKLYRHRINELVQHLGGADMVSAPMRTLVDQAARFHLLTGLAWDALTRYGAYKHGAPTPANDAYRRAAADERSVLLLLGLDRKAKEIPDLAEYLRSKAKPRLTFKGPVEDAEEVGR